MITPRAMTRIMDGSLSGSGASGVGASADRRPAGDGAQCLDATMRTGAPAEMVWSPSVVSARHSSPVDADHAESALPAADGLEHGAVARRSGAWSRCRRARERRGRGGGPAGLQGGEGDDGDTTKNNSQPPGDRLTSGEGARRRRVAPMAKGSRKNEPADEHLAHGEDGRATSQIQGARWLDHSMSSPLIQRRWPAAKLTLPGIGTVPSGLVPGSPAAICRVVSSW